MLKQRGRLDVIEIVAVWWLIIIMTYEILYTLAVHSFRVSLNRQEGLSAHRWGAQRRADKIWDEHYDSGNNSWKASHHVFHTSWDTFYFFQ